MAPSRSWGRLITWTCEHGRRAVCGGDLVGGLRDDLVIEVEAVFEVGFRVGLRINGVVGVGHGMAPVDRGTTESDRERWLTDIQCD